MISDQINTWGKAHSEDRKMFFYPTPTNVDLFRMVVRKETVNSNLDGGQYNVVLIFN